MTAAAEATMVCLMVHHGVQARAGRVHCTQFLLIKQYRFPVLHYQDYQMQQ